MEQTQRTINEQRRLADAGLDAERTDTEADEYGSETITQRELDDLIEHDRIVADTRLLRVRRHTDSMPAPERSTQALRPTQPSRRQPDDDQFSAAQQASDAVASAASHAEYALALTRDQLERYDNILAIVTHDLRSPLIVIGMSAETIADDTQETSTRQIAQLIKQAAARMERLTADLLDAVRIQSGTLSIVKRTQGVDALLGEILKIYGPLFNNRSLSFTIDTPTTTISAAFDYDRIVQVLSNLLGNAMKFTPQGGTVNLQVQQRHQLIEFSVHNSGPGISSSDLPHIFERFWQIDNHARRGLGLGLYICKKIVEGHGGAIAAESEPGKRTTFRFSLPLI